MTLAYLIIKILFLIVLWLFIVKSVVYVTLAQLKMADVILDKSKDIRFGLLIIFTKLLFIAFIILYHIK